jgi:hypothetical protein
LGRHFQGRTSCSRISGDWQSSSWKMNLQINRDQKVSRSKYECEIRQIWWKISCEWKRYFVSKHLNQFGNPKLNTIMNYRFEHRKISMPMVWFQHFESNLFHCFSLLLYVIHWISFHSIPSTQSLLWNPSIRPPNSLKVSFGCD